METYQSVIRPVRIACGVALLVAALGGLHSSVTLPTADRIMAECFNGETLDVTTGECPDETAISNAGTVLDTNPSAHGAEQANMADELTQAGN